jgi:tetratricopeptide (TPR) repeat protein
MLDAEPAVQADLYENLGGIYQNMGDARQAEPLLEKGLERRKAAFGADSEEAAEAMADLSLLRCDEARFAEAETLARDAVAIDRRKRPVGRPALGIALSTLSAVLFHRARYDDAIKVLQKPSTSNPSLPLSKATSWRL